MAESLAASLPLSFVPSRRSEPGINIWLVAITVTLATFMELLDTSIANVALPHIGGGLAVSYDESTWVLTSYLVANAVVLPMSAWLSRVFGRKNYYMFCVGTFTISSLMCGLAPNLGMLVFFRVLQGIGGGGLAPVEQAILVDTFPPEKRASAFALYSMAIVAAPAIGPPLGGWITDSFSWRWIFFINVPIGALSLLLTSRLVHDTPEFTKEVKTARSGGKLQIDLPGILLIALGFGCLEVVLDKGQRDDWFESHFIAAFFTVAMAALVVAVIWELRYKDPVVELGLLRERNFAIASAFYFIFGFTLFGSTVLIPQMLQTLFGYTATDAGLALAPGALVILVMAPIIVRLLPRFGAGKLIFTGFAFTALSFWHFSQLDATATFTQMAIARSFQGFGLGFLFIPTSQLAYSYLPRNKNNKASSITNLFRNQGGSFGIAFVTTLLERRRQFHQSTLTSASTLTDNGVRGFIDQLTQSFQHAGFDAVGAAQRAQAQFYQMIDQQASMQGFLDCFLVLGVVTLAGLPLALGIRKFASGAPSGGH